MQRKNYKIIQNETAVISLELPSSACARDQMCDRLNRNGRETVTY